jgi:ABC-type Zn2+ transport system substrate-binding protein/surface adhesin
VLPLRLSNSRRVARQSKTDPANKEAYEKNAAAYLAKLKELKAWAKREVSKLPREKRKLVTSHDAFQYLARDFGFKIYAIEGVSTEDEPSSRQIADLTEFAATDVTPISGPQRLFSVVSLVSGGQSGHDSAGASRGPDDRWSSHEAQAALGASQR